MFADPLTEKLATFVRGVGIAVHAKALDGATFLPGLEIKDGEIFIDEKRLGHPGDILHEAGHIAVTEPALRKAPEVEADGGSEMAAIAWSYAAARHLDIDPAIVFHPEGYKGGSAAILENFNAGRYIGVPLLQYYDMTIGPPRGREPSAGTKTYPHMLRWMR
jgi:hypothetical protein